MILSIFPKANPLPSNSSEKSKEAWYTSKPHYPEVVNVSTSDDLIEIITNNAWSPSIFSGYRNKNNFVSTDFIVLDIDEGMTIDEAEIIVHKLDIATLCIPSTSYKKEHHKFRLIFPLSKTIRSVESFEDTMLNLAENFPADKACIGDTGRFFFGGKLVDGFFYEACLLDPITSNKPKKGHIKRFEHKGIVSVDESVEGLVELLYGEKRDKIPDNIAYFLENASNGLSGEMYVRANSFLFTASLMGCDKDRIREVFYNLYIHPINSKVEYMVDKVIEEGYEAREDL